MNVTHETIQKVQSFVDALTINHPLNLPKKVVEDDTLFFSWDNEHRSPVTGEPYLYEYSYYNGVIFEGLYYLYQVTGNEVYLSYVNEYLDALLDEEGKLNSHAGYVVHHGLDCYKTADLFALVAIKEENEKYWNLCTQLYDDLAHVNEKYTEEALGGNFWHSWAGGGNAPKYKVWLDGLYMGQPFLTKYAKTRRVWDTQQLLHSVERFEWVGANLMSDKGLLYHAGNSKTDYCNFFWLRAIGWFAMALVDVMEQLDGWLLERMQAVLKAFLAGMLPWQDKESGMWKNLIDQPETFTNPLPRRCFTPW